MKNLIPVFTLLVLFTSCNSENLSKPIALKMLQEQKGYPKTIETAIYIADPVDAKKLLDAGFEKEGYVKIAHTQKLVDVGQPIVTFTEKVRPYLIPQTDDDLKKNIQRVKIAQETISEVVDVKMASDNRVALVSFKSYFENKTPFFEISGIKEKKENVKHIEISIQ